MRTSLKFAYLSGFQAIKLVDRPVPKTIDIFVCEMNQEFLPKTQQFVNYVVHEERVHDNTSCPTIIPAVGLQYFAKQNETVLCEPKHTLNTMYILRSQSVRAQTHAKYNVFSSFLKRASSNTR